MRVHLEPWVTSSQGCKLHCRAHQSLAGDISRVNSWMPKTHRCHFAPCEIVIIFNKEERWYIFICHERWLPPFIRLSTFYMSPEKITHFICRKIGFFVCREKSIRALCTKNFCASNAAIRKILGFLASGSLPLLLPAPPSGAWAQLSWTPAQRTPASCEEDLVTADNGVVIYKPSLSQLLIA